MSEAGFYYRMGFWHIIDWQGYDHLLFLVALIAGYILTEWRQVLVLVTAFTLGHSLTLALTAFDLLHFRSAWVEFLIPITILFTAVGNAMVPRDRNQKFRWLHYFMALVFGLVHGMAYSGYFHSLLRSSASVLKPLLLFNLGIETGQLLVVGILFGIGALVVKVLSFKARWWMLSLSVIAAIWSVWMVWDRVPDLG